MKGSRVKGFDDTCQVPKKENKARPVARIMGAAAWNGPKRKAQGEGSQCGPVRFGPRFGNSAALGRDSEHGIHVLDRRGSKPRGTTAKRPQGETRMKRMPGKHVGAMAACPESGSTHLFSVLRRKGLETSTSSSKDLRSPLQQQRLLNICTPTTDNVVYLIHWWPVGFFCTCTKVHVCGCMRILTMPPSAAVHPSMELVTLRVEFFSSSFFNTGRLQQKRRHWPKPQISILVLTSGPKNSS